MRGVHSGGVFDEEEGSTKKCSQYNFTYSELLSARLFVPNTSCQLDHHPTLHLAIRKFHFSSPSIQIASITSLFLQSRVKRPESVGQALEISPPENNPLRIFSLPKNPLLEVGIFLPVQFLICALIVPSPRIVVRQVTNDYRRLARKSM